MELGPGGLLSSVSEAELFGDGLPVSPFDTDFTAILEEILPLVNGDDDDDGGGGGGARLEPLELDSTLATSSLPSVVSLSMLLHMITLDLCGKT
jgi:hypothetical protein